MSAGKATLIHIGYPKSASTWLQRFLFTPQFGFCRTLDHVMIKFSIIAPSPFRYHPDGPRALHDEKAAAAPGKVPVISSEVLSGNMWCGGYDARQNADRLRETFPDARVLLLTREQRSFIRALYKSYVEWGLPHSLDRMLAPHEPGRFPQFNLDWLDYSGVASYYIELFGRDRVLVLPYELIKRDIAGFVGEVLAFSGSDASVEDIVSRPRATEPMNETLPMTNNLLKRWYNLLFISNPANYAGLFASPRGTGAYKPRRYLDRLWVPEFINRPLEQRFRDKVLRATEGSFREGNRRLQGLCHHSLAELGYEI